MSGDTPGGVRGRLQGLVCVITGAGSGIGRATALIASGEGATVVVLDFDAAAAEEVAREIGYGTIAVRVDVSDRAEVDAAIDRVIAKYGRIDVLVNVAGVNDKMTPLEELDRDIWAKVFDINVWGTAVVSARAAREMRGAGKGAIVNVSSTASVVAGGGGVAYTASKGAVASMTREMAYELADHGVRVNAVAPGITSTNLRRTSFYHHGSDNLSPGSAALYARAAAKAPANIPLGRAATPQEVANVIVFLASPEASYVTGAVMVVDGGLTIH